MLAWIRLPLSIIQYNLRVCVCLREVEHWCVKNIIAEYLDIHTGSDSDTFSTSV